MNIGLDFDGVITKSTQTLKTMLAHKLYKLSIPPERFNAGRALKEGLISEEQYAVIKRMLFQSRDYVEFVPAAAFYMDVLRKNGHAHTVVTSRYGESLAIAKDVLHEYGFYMPIIGIERGSDKVAACEGLDVFIDDMPEKLLPLIGRVPHLLLMNWPHNADAALPKPISRVGSWWEIYNYIWEEAR